MSSTPKECVAKDLVQGAKIGLSLTAGAGALSAGAVLIVAAMVLYRVHERRRDPAAHLRPAVKTHVDFYMISLLVSDMLQAVGGIINVYHVRKGQTACGPYCTAQGALKSLGEPSAAMATMAITVHTFCVIFFHWAPPSNFLLPSLVVAGIWLYCALYVGIAWVLHHDPGEEFFQPVPYWCWVSRLYPDERISAEYFWLWFSAFASILLYVPLFLFVRGNIEVDAMRPWRIKWRRTSPTRTTSSFNRVRQSLKMLLYPVVYLIIVLPLSVVRYITFIHGDKAVPMAGTFVGIIPFHLSGLLNVLLLIFTRPSILVFGGHFDTYGGTTTESRVTGGAGAARYNISQAMEVSVHVQQDVVYGYEDPTGRHKMARLDFSPRTSAKRLNSDPSVIDIKPETIHLDDMPRSPPRTRR